VLIVDGNNVPSPPRPWHPPGCPACRRLVVEVARLTRDWESCADVVFDGHPRAALRHGSIVSAVRVLFSGWHTADDRIVELLAEHDPTEAFVVTSDRDLRWRVLARGARVVSSETLRRALDMVCAATHAGTPLRTPLVQRPQALLAFEREGAAWPITA
jgi:hypothetical protein